VAVFLFAFLAQRLGKIGEDTSAANLNNFQAGYIISDYQMTDYKSMSEWDIQNWLNSKNSCSNTTFTPTTNKYRWHFENGHYICLAQEHFGDRDGEIGFQYSETAAHIIWQAAQDYRINPKVLLVLLQKETGLITDPIPNDWDYRRATGYGCPDTAACSEKYYGFKNQVRNAAYLFRIVMDGNSSYYPIGNNYVQYNPNAGCGGSVVYIKNLATSALYRYTPYQPNAGALAAGYGTAPCGAYGNRNFYAYFEDWFGGITWEKYDPTNDIDKVYQKTGGEKGVLGRKISGYSKNETSGIYWIEYEHGYIIGDKNHGFYISMGPIRDKWVAQNYEFGMLGWPKSDIQTNKDSGIEYQEYEHGYIVGNKQHGYYYSMGKIRDKWASQWYESGPLGWPKSDIQTNKDSGIEYQEYEHGYIVGNKQHGYYYSMGKIRDKWVAQGYEFGALGWPKSDIQRNEYSGLEYQEYENGYIIGDSKKGFFVSMGKIRDKWVAQGYEFGVLGWPKSDILEKDGIQYQEYDGGKIYYSSGYTWVE